MTDTLSLVAQIAALIGAVLYIVVSPLELIFYERPWARKFLNVETEDTGETRMWAFVVGARNLLVGAAVLIGLALFWSGDQATGTVIVVSFSWYMLLASLAMGVADLLGFWRPRGGSIGGTIGSSIPPLIVIVSSFF